jgi:nucleoside-diphosphate-sugar epimerase
MLNVLITGSSGFIGNHLRSQFEGKFNLFLPERNDFNSDTLLNNIDIVIHLAGKAHDISDSHDLDQYTTSNTNLTNSLFEKFIKSDSSVFIFMSSILVLSSTSTEPLTEEFLPNPVTDYARSKFDSELYISKSKLPPGKRVYILRTPLVYGEGNKGNLVLLYDFIKKIPFWPLGKYNSLRSFCDIRNLSFVIENLISRSTIENGIYHVADNDPYKLNELYIAFAKLLNKKARVVNFPKRVVYLVFLFGSVFDFPFNLKRLNKLTSSLLVDNTKIKVALNSDLPYGILKDIVRCFKK